MNESRIQYALAYVKLGWAVLPCHWITEQGACSCRKSCSSPGKHPLTKNGVNDATNDPGIINGWFHKWPDANIGVATGKVSGILVLDVDTKSGGFDSLDKIIEENGPIPDDCLAVSGSGGRHYVFKYPGKVGRTTTHLWPGIDIRGDGGYVVVAPSNHISGKNYFWDAEADPLAGVILLPETPEWLIKKLGRKYTGTPTIPGGGKVLPPTEIKRIRSALACIPEFDDYTPWVSIGMALASSGAEEQAFSLWTDWASQSDKFNLKEHRKKWKSFKSDGGVALGTLFGLAKQHGWIDPEPAGPPEPPFSVYAEDLARLPPGKAVRPREQLEQLIDDTGGMGGRHKQAAPSMADVVMLDNAILDADIRYCSVDLVKHVPDDHLMKRLAVDVAQATFLPVNTVMLMGLGVFSAMACWRFAVPYEDGSLLPIGLYVVAEQPPGAAKSRCLRIFQKPFHTAALELRDQATKKLRSYASKEARREILTEDELVDREAMVEAKKRADSGSFLTNCTPEGLEKTMAVNSGFFAAVSSEQGLLNSLLGKTYQQGDGSGHNNDVVLNAFDGGFISSARAARAGYSGHVVGGIAGFAQAGTVERVMGASNGVGLSERFLMLAEQHNLGGRDHTVRHHVGEELQGAYARACAFFKSGLEEVPDFNRLSRLHISEKGFDMIAEYRNSIEPHLGDGGKYSHLSLRGAASKADMQIMKLAANLHLTVGKAMVSDRIPDTVVKAAIGLCDELMTANVQLCTNKGFIGQRSEFTAILALFERDPRPKSARMVQQVVHKTKPFCDFTGSRSGLIKGALAEMEEQGLLVSVREGRKIVYSVSQ